ncbi:MAG: hypothetical protein ACTSPI_17380 [Candidatus Heimdallarchaeaceae archaeon]
MSEENLPEEIRVQEIEVLDKIKSFAETQRLEEMSALSVEMDIVNDKDLISGKFTFSNERARKAELGDRLIKNGPHQEFVKRTKEVERQFKESEIQLRFLQNKFKLQTSRL